MTFDNEADFMTPSRPKANLIVKQGPQIGIHFSITVDKVVLGREETCEITIQDAEVSRRHTQISWEEETFVIRDMGSTNGTFLNGMQITQATPLKDGDSVGLGQTTLILAIEADSLSATAEYVTPPYQQPPPMSTSSLEQKSGLSRRQKGAVLGCGCLLLLCISSIAIPAILHFAGVVNLTDLLQTLLQEGWF